MRCSSSFGVYNRVSAPPETLSSIARWAEDVGRPIYYCRCFCTDDDPEGTTTGMVTACLIATAANWHKGDDDIPTPEETEGVEIYDSMDGPSEEEAYLQGMSPQPLHGGNSRLMRITVGEYKTILQLVGVLSHGKVAKRLTDQAIDLMQDVQNLRKAIYEYVASSPPRPMSPPSS